MPRARALLLAIAALAASCGRAPPPATDTPGARLYVAYCVACHRPDGGGVAGMQPPLAGTPVAIGEPEPLLGWVLYGRRPAALPRGVYAGVMPQFAYLSDEDLATLLSYVRSQFGNHAAPVTPAMVAAARAAHLR